MTDLVAAEWLKLRTTRILMGAIPAAVLLSVASVAGVIAAANGAADLERVDTTRRVFAVTGTGAVVMLVVGILLSAGEYRHGTAADTFLTTPRRHRVVVAKLVTGAAVGTAVGALTCVVASTLAAVLYRAAGAALPYGDADVWLTLAGAVVYTALFAVLGVSVATLVRNQVMAVAAALAWIGIVEHTLVNLLPAIGRWLPAAAGQAIVRTPVDGLLSPVAGVAVLVAFAATIAASGVRFAVTRDA